MAQIMEELGRQAGKLRQSETSDSRKLLPHLSLESQGHGQSFWSPGYRVTWQKVEPRWACPKGVKAIEEVPP